MAWERGYKRDTPVVEKPKLTNIRIKWSQRKSTMSYPICIPILMHSQPPESAKGSGVLSDISFHMGCTVQELKSGTRVSDSSIFNRRIWSFTKTMKSLGTAESKQLFSTFKYNPSHHVTTFMYTSTNSCVDRLNTEGGRDSASRLMNGDQLPSAVSLR